MLYTFFCVVFHNFDLLFSVTKSHIMVGINGFSLVSVLFLRGQYVILLIKHFCIYM